MAEHQGQIFLETHAPEQLVAMPHVLTRSQDTLALQVAPAQVSLIKSVPVSKVVATRKAFYQIKVSTVDWAYLIIFCC